MASKAKGDRPYYYNQVTGKSTRKHPNPCYPFHIEIKDLFEKNIVYCTVYVRASDTIKNVKDKIQAQAQIIRPRFQLVLAGKYLDDKKTLSDYNIEKESTDMQHLY